MASEETKSIVDYVVVVATLLRAHGAATAYEKTELIEKALRTICGNQYVDDLFRDAKSSPLPDRDSVWDEIIPIMGAWSVGRGWHALLQYAGNLWDTRYGKYTHSGARYEFVTGGWSENEAIIRALKCNAMFMKQCFVSSERGGRHVFVIREGNP